jgi:hypothetical protein
MDGETPPSHVSIRAVRSATRPSAIEHRLRAGAAALVLATALSGCGAGGRAEQLNLEADPASVVQVLPTRPGLSPAGRARELDPAGFAMAALGRPEPALARSARGAGLRKAAVRRWTGPDGARLTVVVGLWDDGEAANAIGGEITTALVPDGTAWTPRGLGAAQGRRTDNARALNSVIGRVSLLVSARGPVDDAQVLRTTDLLRKTAGRRDLREAGG